MNALVDERSTYRTVLNVLAALDAGNALPDALRDEVATWLLTHTHPQRGYVYFPEAATLAEGIRYLTGERPNTQLALLTGVELETLRLLLLLRPGCPEVGELCDLAEERLAGKCYGRICAKAECAWASISVLRYHLTRRTEAAPDLLARGLAFMAQDRIGAGRHRAFPYFYSLLWLVEMAERAEGKLARAARAELVYMDAGRAMRLGRAAAPWMPVRRQLLARARAAEQKTAGA
jgi:hypothetical protein